MGLLYWTGMLRGEKQTARTAATLDWLKGPEKQGKVDWLDRREKVVDAFTLSWDAYKRYAWGRFDPLIGIWKRSMLMISVRL